MHMIIVLCLFLLGCFVKSRWVYAACMVLIFFDGLFVATVELSTLRPIAEAQAATGRLGGGALDGVAFASNHLSPYRLHLILVMASLCIASLVGRWRQ